MLFEDDDDVNNPSSSTVKLKYTCLRNMQSVVEACSGRPESVEDVLAIRRAYVALRGMLDEGGDLNYLYSMVVTGHPGTGAYGSNVHRCIQVADNAHVRIGKRVFLVYLLLCMSFLVE